MFIMRRTISSLLLDTFLGSQHGVDDTYSENRSLLAEILVDRDMRESGRSCSGMNISDRYGIPSQREIKRYQTSRLSGTCSLLGWENPLV